ncbi:hypothetical protein C7M84_001244, partial [Penaeus vannamei]
VCQEERREEEVFTLAMNMMDRFLSLVTIRRQQLQLLGTVCLFLASKIKESPPLDPHLLAQYTADSITVEEIRKWELLVLTRLKWDLAAITPHAFLDQIIARLQLKLPEAQMRMVREHATFFITVCATGLPEGVPPSDRDLDAVERGVAVHVHVTPDRHAGGHVLTAVPTRRPLREPSPSPRAVGWGGRGPPGAPWGQPQHCHILQSHEHALPLTFRGPPPGAQPPAPPPPGPGRAHSAPAAPAARARPEHRAESDLNAG